MTTIGYARVSTTDQDLSLQIAALKTAGCTTIRAEKQSGDIDRQARRVAHRARLRTGRRRARGDEIDRLARSIADLAGIVGELTAKGVTLKATEQPIDTGSAAGRAFQQMLGVFAEFETAIRKERQMEGIRAAQNAASTRAGRRPSTRQGYRAQGRRAGADRDRRQARRRPRPSIGRWRRTRPRRRREPRRRVESPPLRDEPKNDLMMRRLASACLRLPGKAAFYRVKIAPIQYGHRLVQKCVGERFSNQLHISLRPTLGASA